MRRRDFMVMLAGATAAWPLVVRAQQASRPMIGFLSSGSEASWQHFVVAFREGLRETGHADGQNVTIESRWADGQYGRLPAMAADLVARRAAVLVSTGGAATIMAAKEATSTIPIVFTLGTDPVRLGIVSSLNRPGGNITGAFLFTSEIDTKRLGLLRDTVPTATLIAALINPDNPPAQNQARGIENAARAVGRQVHVLRARALPEVEAAFASVTQLRAGGLLVAADPFFNTHREQIVAMAARHAVPAIYEQREFVAAGGLMSYGSNFADSYRQAGIYVGRILKGEKPGDLPVVQSTKFEFVLNLKTAKALDLTVPSGVLAQADEVIE
jgi:putative ABC transport system substrate-binding protein